MFVIVPIIAGAGFLTLGKAIISCKPYGGYQERPNFLGISLLQVTIPVRLLCIMALIVELSSALFTITNQPSALLGS
jgi:hypothetical protein